MKPIAKNILVLSLLVALVALTLHPAAALGANGETVTTEEETRLEEISGEEMMVDFFFLRPAGLLATVVGSAFFVVSLPLNYATGATRPAYKKLVVNPAQYTFRRTLGDF
jgi:hypothetical protein